MNLGDVNFPNKDELVYAILDQQAIDMAGKRSAARENKANAKRAEKAPAKAAEAAQKTIDFATAAREKPENQKDVAEIDEFSRTIAVKRADILTKIPK